MLSPRDYTVMFRVNVTSEASTGQRERERADKAEEALWNIQRQMRRAPKDNADQVMHYQVTFALRKSHAENATCNRYLIPYKLLACNETDV